MQLAQQMAQGKRFAIVEAALKKYTVLLPKDPQGWGNLAALQLALNKRGEMLVSLQKAVECGGEPARNMLRKDKRFDPVRNTPEFQKIVPSLAQPGSGMTPLPGM